jgi:hypothetical protein
MHPIPLFDIAELIECINWIASQDFSERDTRIGAIDTLLGKISAEIRTDQTQAIIDLQTLVSMLKVVAPLYPSDQMSAAVAAAQDAYNEMTTPIQPGS